MKRLSLAGAILGAVAGLGVMLAPSAFAAGSTSFNSKGLTPNITVTVALTGYCDTFTFHVPSVGSGLPHTLDGTHNLIDTCGGTEDYYDIGYTLGTSAATEIESGILVLYIFRSDGTWSNYYDCTGTGTECHYLDGTWSITAAPQHGKRPGASSAPHN